MAKTKNRTIGRRFRSATALVIIGCTVLGIAPFVHADVFQDQINSLNAQNTQVQQTIGQLQQQATSYQDAINQLQQQIAGVQQSIVINQDKQATLEQEIADDQIKIQQEKGTLAQNLKAQYADGQMSTIEMLATSQNINVYIDRQAYEQAVQGQIQQTLDQIAATETQEQQQKEQVTQLIGVLNQQQSQLSADESQQSQLLAYDQTQQASYNQQIQNNQAQIAILRAEQIAANKKLVGQGKVDFSGSCGGSYPAVASGPYGSWGCNYGLDNTIDNWGMYNRECVSYTAWMVYKTYGYMPYWGGSGDANQWPGDARAAGIPTGSTPQVNSVAIYMGGASDPWGHAMWVKSVNGDGTITVDQYNLYYDGNYYETTIPADGLVYIYFGQ